MAKRFGMDQKTILCHLEKMAILPNLLNGNLLKVSFHKDE